MSIDDHGESRMTYRTSTKVPNFSALDNIVQCLHDLLAWRLSVQPVNLQYINVCAQTLDAGIDSVENMLSRQAGAIDPRAVISSRGGNGREVPLIIDTEEAFGQNDHAVARNIILLQSFSNNFLGFSMGVNVGLVTGY